MPEGSFFRHFRSGTTFSLATGGTTRRAVRNHRAPKGALRRLNTKNVIVHTRRVRKHRAPKGALRLSLRDFHLLRREGVRKHRAPKGALRQVRIRSDSEGIHVRKHRAPNGALRLDISRPGRVYAVCQKAPSAKRCIKTAIPGPAGWHPRKQVRKHRAPKGALRLRPRDWPGPAQPRSESIERQKVH